MRLAVDGTVTVFKSGHLVADLQRPEDRRASRDVNEQREKMERGSRKLPGGHITPCRSPSSMPPPRGEDRRENCSLPHEGSSQPQPGSVEADRRRGTIPEPSLRPEVRSLGLRFFLMANPMPVGAGSGRIFLDNGGGLMGKVWQAALRASKRFPGCSPVTATPCRQAGAVPNPASRAVRMGDDFPRSRECREQRGDWGRCSPSSVRGEDKGTPPPSLLFEVAPTSTPQRRGLFPG